MRTLINPEGFMTSTIPISLRRSFGSVSFSVTYGPMAHGAEAIDKLLEHAARIINEFVLPKVQPHIRPIDPIDEAADPPVARSLKHESTNDPDVVLMLEFAAPADEQIYRIEHNSVIPILSEALDFLSYVLAQIRLAHRCVGLYQHLSSRQREAFGSLMPPDLRDLMEQLALNDAVGIVVGMSGPFSSAGRPEGTPS